MHCWQILDTHPALLLLFVTVYFSSAVQFCHDGLCPSLLAQSSSKWRSETTFSHSFSANCYRACLKVHKCKRGNETQIKIKNLCLSCSRVTQITRRLLWRSWDEVDELGCERCCPLLSSEDLRMVMVSYQCHVGLNNYQSRCLYNVMTLYQCSECDPVLSRGITLYVTPMKLGEIHPTDSSTLSLPPSFGYCEKFQIDTQ